MWHCASNANVWMYGCNKHLTLINTATALRLIWPYFKFCQSSWVCVCVCVCWRSYVCLELYESYDSWQKDDTGLVCCSSLYLNGMPVWQWVSSVLAGMAGGLCDGGLSADNLLPSTVCTHRHWEQSWDERIKSLPIYAYTTLCLPLFSPVYYYRLC